MEPLHKIARRALAYALDNGGKTPAADEIGASGHPEGAGQKLAFVTAYRGGTVVASSGRVRCLKPDTLSELLDNAAKCAADPRLAEAGIKKGKDLEPLRFRVDLIEKPRMVKSPDEVDALREGILVIRQDGSALGAVLPKVAPAVTGSRELFALALRKAGLPENAPEKDLAIYALASDVSSDF